MRFKDLTVAQQQNRVMELFRERHGEQWVPLGATATDYAWVVMMQRMGERKSLSFNSSLATTGGPDWQNRKIVRDQIDAILAGLNAEPDETRPATLPNITPRDLELVLADLFTGTAKAEDFRDAARIVTVLEPQEIKDTLLQAVKARR